MRKLTPEEVHQLTGRRQSNAAGIHRKRTPRGQERRQAIRASREED